MNDDDRLGDWRARRGSRFAGLRESADTEDERHVLDVAQVAGAERFQRFGIAMLSTGDVDKRICVL